MASFSDKSLHELLEYSDELAEYPYELVAALAKDLRDERIHTAQSEVFLQAVREENRRARNKFPSPKALNTALSEEVGELSKALLEEPWPNVYAEAVQVASTAMRLALEGDPTLNEVRLDRGQALGPTFDGLPQVD